MSKKKREYTDKMEGIIPFGCRWTTSQFNKSGRRITLHNCGMSLHSEKGKIIAVGVVLTNSNSLMRCVKRNPRHSNFIFREGEWCVFLGATLSGKRGG